MDNFFLKGIPSTAKVLLGFRIPLRVTQYITYRCNLDCQYCSRNVSDNHELTTEEIKILMSGFRGAGTLFWGFNGGEALIRHDIGELIDYGKSLGMFMNIATNGTLLAKKCREISNIDMVNISFEGPKTIHDRVRSGSFDRMYEGVETIRMRGIKFTFTTCLNNGNLDSLDFILNFAEKYGTRVSFQPVRVQKEDNEGKSRKLFPARDRMRKAIDYLLREREKGRAVATSANYLRQIRELWPDGNPNTRCWAGRLYCSITPEGSVTACCDTLAGAVGGERGQPPERIVEEFFRLPAYKCSTCFASVPLEANLAMSECFRNPFAAASQVAEFIPRNFWHSRR